MFEGDEPGGISLFRGFPSRPRTVKIGSGPSAHSKETPSASRAGRTIADGSGGRLDGRSRWVVAMLLCAAPYLRAAGRGQEPAQAEQEPAQPAQEQPQPGQVSSGTRATVRGTVKNSATGEPLPRALVQIEGDADTGALTDGEGQFEIPGVPVGPQAFRVVKPGFRDRPYATEETGLQSEGPAHSILVSQQMPELRLRLRRMRRYAGASISRRGIRLRELR